MSVAITRRAAIAGAFGLMLYGAAAVRPAQAVTTASGGGPGRYSTPVSKSDKDVPKANVVTFDSYQEIPTGCMNVVLRNYLQLLDLTFEQTGFDASAADTGGALKLENGKFAGLKTDDVVVKYGSIETGKEKPSMVYFGFYGALDDHCESKTQEVIDGLVQSLDLDSLEYTTEQSEDINCSILVKGVDIVLDITNYGGKVGIAIRTSDSHSDVSASVDVTGLVNLTNWAWSIDASGYTADSYNNMVALMSEGGAAWSVLNNSAPTAAELFDATSQLQSAIDSLVTVAFPFTADEYLKSLNGAFETLRQKKNYVYIALPGETKDGAAAIFVYDSNMQGVALIALLDVNGASVPTADVGGICKLLIFQASSQDDFIPVVLASIMAEGSAASLSTAADVCSETLDSALAGGDYWYGGRRFEFQLGDSSVFIISSI